MRALETQHEHKKAIRAVPIIATIVAVAITMTTAAPAFCEMTAATADIASESDEDIFIMPKEGDADDAIKALENSGISIENVEKFDHGVIKVDVGSESEDALEAVAEAVPNMEAAPVKTYAVDAKDPSASSQTAFYRALDTATSPSYGETGHGFGKVRSLASNTGRHMLVAVIDSGFRKTHLELRGRLREDLAYDAMTKTEGKIGEDDFGHGTEVASVIAANENNGIGGRGVCSNVDIVPIKAADENGCLNDASVLAGLEHIEKLAASGKAPELKVVNLSFGVYYTDKQKSALKLGDIKADPIYAELRRLHDDYGMAIVCSGGNGYGDGLRRHNGGFHVPSDYDCCVSVHGCVDGIDSAPYADVNSEKDISALVDALAADPTNDREMEDVEGTSFAAPYVAGAIASLLQLNPSLTTDDAVKLLKRTATPFQISSNTSNSPANGSAGVMNVEKAAWRALGGGAFWNGMTECVSYKGLVYGVKVLSSKNRTVALTRVLHHDGNMTTISFPSSLKLSDGRKYKVVENGIVDFNVFGKVKNIVCPAGMSRLRWLSMVPFSCSDYTPEDTMHYLSSVTIKSRNLTKARVKDCFCHDSLTVKKVIVDVSKSHKVNVYYAKKYRKLFNEKVTGSRILRVVAK